MRWRRNPYGYTATDVRGVRWLARGPVFGRPVYWVYRNGVRFDHGTDSTPSPHTTMRSARAACEAQSQREAAEVLAR